MSSISSIEEYSSNHENCSKEWAPKSFISVSCNNCFVSTNSTLFHGSSESWANWTQWGSFTHPFISFTFSKAFKFMWESKSTSLGLSSLDEVFSSSGRGLEINWFFGNSSGGSSFGCVRSIGGVQHSTSRTCFRNSTIDITTDISRTSNGD